MAKQLDGRSSLDSQRERKGPHRPSLWAGGLSLLLLILIISIRFLGDRLYDYPLYSDPKSFPPDAVVICLAGGKFRVEAAYELYASGVGNKLLIVGAGKKSTATGLGKTHAEEIAEKIPPDRFAGIEVETESKNTIENAFAVARYLERNSGAKNLVLVTSGYHMRRAQLMIDSQVQRDVKIFPYIPPADALAKSNWWHTWLGIEVTTFEYVKFILASLLVPHLSYF